jgi:hypothetical protein
MYNQPEHYGKYVLLNRPVKIRMLGWESDTHKLQRAGWQISVEELRMEASYRDTIRVALKHPVAKVYCITNHVDIDFASAHLESFIVLDVVQLACDIQVKVIPDDFSHFRPVDAEPVYVDAEYRNIESFKIFKPLAKEKEIIIPQESVGDLLQKIQLLQEPYQEEMREAKRAAMRKFNREVNDYQLGTNIVAQVATLV